MKIAETWALVEEKTHASNTRNTTKAAFAAGVRAVAVEMLMHSNDVLNEQDSGALYSRLMAAADRIER